jgi:hypothetical protein
MGTDSFKVIFTNRTCLALGVADPTGDCVPLDDLEYFCVLFLHFSERLEMIYAIGLTIN